MEGYTTMIENGFERFFAQNNGHDWKIVVLLSEICADIT